jgi:glycosyltransferase involved in cell wall biosynthesis
LVFERSDRVLVATPDLLEWVPGAELVTQAIDLESVDAPPPPRERPEPYVVLHAPSDRLIKGTRYVEAAVARLQAAGYPVQLRLMHGKPHSEVRRALAEADIVVDQLLMGWYANFSIEAMASGRPVIAYIRDSLKQVAGYEPPILSANPETIDAALIQLIEDATLRKELALAGPPYVRRIHDAARIARQLVEVYQDRRR